MGKFNWEKLKKEYILGDIDSLREFAKYKKLNYTGYYMQKTKGWGEERVAVSREMSCKTIKKTIEKVAEAESDINSRHVSVWNKILNKIESIIGKDKLIVSGKFGRQIETDVTPKALSELATAMEKVQKGQRLALGIDKGDNQADLLRDTNQKIQTLAELLNNPEEDRPVEEFEKDE